MLAQLYNRRSGAGTPRCYVTSDLTATSVNHDPAYAAEIESPCALPETAVSLTRASPSPDRRNHSDEFPSRKCTTSVGMLERHCNFSNSYTNTQQKFRLVEDDVNADNPKQLTTKPEIKANNSFHQENEFSRVLRFSAKNNLHEANLLRGALEDALGHSGPIADMLKPEFLDERRYLFFETLFRKNGEPHIPRLDTEESACFFSESLDQIFGSRYHRTLAAFAAN